ncbi:MAG TPA: hypothetical protein VG713_13750, partial [Pirellulales bacterium]|nr:hypothetical protein [Pirellulales bacterium]
MASIGLEGDRSYRIQFQHPNGRKYSLRLGALALGRVKAIKVHIEQMVAALKAGVPFEPGLQRWV